MLPQTTHAIVGSIVIVAPLLIVYLKHKSLSLPLAWASVVAAWYSLLPAGQAYLGYYQSLKGGIKEGSMPWAHLILMETKEHWGLLAPLLATTALILMLKKEKNVERWWVLTSVVSIAIYIMGKFIRSAIVAG